MSPVPNLASESRLGQSCTPPVGLPHTSAVDPIEEWGRRFGLDAEECGFLRKLGFRIGDNLEAISDRMWELAAIPVCRRLSILSAYSRSLEASATASLE